MRIRTIKPEFWTSEDIAALDMATRLLFIGLWSYVDDNGVGVDRPTLIAAALFPEDLSRDSHDTLATLSRGLQALSEAGLITRYTCNGGRYLEVTSWHRHQKIDRPSKGRYPQYSAENCEPSRDTRETLATGTEEQGNRGTEEQGITPQLTSFAGPSRDEHTGDAQETPSKPKREPRGTRITDDWQPSEALKAWTRENAPAAANPREVAKFVDHFLQQPGRYGVKLSWDAAWRNWARRTQENAEKQPKTYRSQNDIMADIYQQASAQTALMSSGAFALIEGGKTA